MERHEFLSVLVFHRKLIIYGEPVSFFCQGDLVAIDRFGIVAAMSRDGVIGLNGKLPWHLPEDRQSFKELTRDKILVIGRKTFEEEPNLCHIDHAARCIILSKSLSQESFKSSSKITLSRSFREALHIAKNLSESFGSEKNSEDIHCWIAGGEKLYHEALLHPSAAELHLTVVDAEIDIERATDVARLPAKYRWDNKFKEKFKEIRQSENDILFTNYIFTRLKGRR